MGLMQRQSIDVAGASESDPRKTLKCFWLKNGIQAARAIDLSAFILIEQIVC